MGDLSKNGGYDYLMYTSFIPYVCNKTEITLVTCQYVILKNKDLKL